MVQEADGSGDAGSAEQERKPSVKKEKSLDVRTLRTKGGSALVEYVERGFYRRVYIPFEEIENGKVKPSILEAGIVYGEPWEDFMEVIATPEAMANELRRRGVWTVEDVTPVIIQKVNKAFDERLFLKRTSEIIKGR